MPQPPPPVQENVELPPDIPEDEGDDDDRHVDAGPWLFILGMTAAGLGIIAILLAPFFAIVALATVYFYCATVIDMARILNVPIFGMNKATAVKITPAKVLTKAELVASGEKRSTPKAH